MDTQNKKIDLKDLNTPIKYHWRVQSFSKNKAKCSCVAYVDARDVMSKLDEVVGVGGWQDNYEVVGDKLMCSLGIRVGKEWVWKQDTGTAGNIEIDKSIISDAFKRAAVKWGVGRFLYDLPIVYLDSNEVNTGKNYPYVVDESRQRIYDITGHIEKYVLQK